MLYSIFHYIVLYSIFHYIASMLYSIFHFIVLYSIFHYIALYLQASIQQKISETSFYGNVFTLVHKKLSSSSMVWQQLQGRSSTGSGDDLWYRPTSIANKWEPSRSRVRATRKAVAQRHVWIIRGIICRFLAYYLLNLLYCDISAKD